MTTAGIRHSKATKKKISETMRLYHQSHPVTEESRKKMSEARKKRLALGGDK
jgi:hypothetical protein